MSTRRRANPPGSSAPEPRDKIIRSITAADVQRLANQYLRDDKLQRVRIVSDKMATKAAATK